MDPAPTSKPSPRRLPRICPGPGLRISPTPAEARRMMDEFGLLVEDELWPDARALPELLRRLKQARKAGASPASSSDRPESPPSPETGGSTAG